MASTRASKLLVCVGLPLIFHADFARHSCPFAFSTLCPLVKSRRPISLHLNNRSLRKSRCPYNTARSIDAQLSNSHVVLMILSITAHCRTNLDIVNDRTNVNAASASISYINMHQVFTPREGLPASSVESATCAPTPTWSRLRVSPTRRRLSFTSAR